MNQGWSGEAQNKKGERVRGQKRVIPIKGPCADNDTHNLRTQHEKQEAQRNHKKNDLANSGSKDRDEFLLLPRVPMFRKRWKRGNGIRNADNANRKKLDVVGELKNRDASCGKGRSNHAKQNKMNVTHCERKDARTHEPQHLSRVRIGGLQPPLIAIPRMIRTNKL